MIVYLIASILIAAAAFLVRRERQLFLTGVLFYAVQAAFACAILFGGLYDTTSASWFRFDAPGTLFYVLLCIVSAFAYFHSEAYLRDNDLVQTRAYSGLVMLLTTAIAGSYFASNLAVTWIFLEATTLCSAGIIYHRRTAQTLEAAWKYVFVCSTGIAMAYLGILLLAAATDCESLDYAEVAAAAPHGNALYLKIAFLLIVCGYSCKMELFPLYTVGIDANFAAPSPASALISTGLVNAGFLAIFRVYRVVAATEVFTWARSVLLIVGVLSLLIGALFLRRTNNYKRFLSYSTVENMGLAAIGLGVGGAGVWAAVFHVVCHTFIKSSLFLQMAVVRQVYNGYRINRIGDYIHINRVGAMGLLAGMVILVAFPPSPLFLSELMILREAIVGGRWWLVAGLLLLLCIVIYSFCSRMLRLCYQPNQDELHPSKVDRALSWSALTLLAAAMVLGLWQPDFLRELIGQITAL
ncbi:hydrogenase 4 subunit F [Alistipes sp. An116]|uniref:complex I subunit 5 family protein n=1 Tax=Alistipes TaxID=239759 RepID=UPI000B3A8E68|nr:MULTISPECIES: proton-conducting transporter membrane subunit [Alistipes]OUQ53303.1 hydrogenase 4 subunit F [Alistipes sp. An116]